MRVGLQIGLANTQQKAPGERLALAAEQAEQAGFSTLVIPDHFSLRPESTAFIRREANAPTQV